MSGKGVHGQKLREINRGSVDESVEAQGRNTVINSRANW